jgi:hypothetical protein
MKILRMKLKNLAWSASHATQCSCAPEEKENLGAASNVAAYTQPVRWTWPSITKDDTILTTVHSSAHWADIRPGEHTFLHYPITIPSSSGSTLIIDHVFGSRRRFHSRSGLQQHARRCHS